MPKSLKMVAQSAIVTGWDFSTGAVKCLAFELNGNVLAEVRLPTDLWTEGGVSELNLMQLEGQARATVRAMSQQLADQGRLSDWVCGGISATHHTAGRIDKIGNPIRRAICWNDQTLAPFHAEGLKRLGGQQRVQELIGGPWASRYSLSHLVKDEQTLSQPDWERTEKILPHGPLSAGYLTSRFDCISVSSAASTGMLDLRSERWQLKMLSAIKSQALQDLAARCLPKLIDMDEPIGPLARHVVAGTPLENASTLPLVFPTLDDQAAGLVGGGAVNDGQLAIILGNSAVVNSSSATAPENSQLDAMKLNWGNYLWMRCYTNGAQFLDRVVGKNPDWDSLEAQARAVPPGCDGVTVSPFVFSEPSLGVTSPRFGWQPSEPSVFGVKVRASFEALAYLIALAVREHEAAGQKITRVTVSGGIARSELMGEILASVLNRPIDRLVSSEGPALGAALAALAGYESYCRKQKGDLEPYSVGDAIETMVRFRTSLAPKADWTEAYRSGLAAFAEQLSSSS